jgi:hypothetical protein
MTDSGFIRAIAKASLIQRLRHRWFAQSMASSAKRLDICAAEVANYFLLSGMPKQPILRDKVCLEVGSGWLLTHSLIFYLLGAKKVYATDIEALFQPQAVAKAIQSSIDWVVLDSLSAFEKRSSIQARLERLQSVEQYSIESLRDLGIEYIAPLDLSREPLHHYNHPDVSKADFIFSKSVLEHVPTDDVPLLLNNLEASLSDSGFMFHLIHLDDHKNLSDPFAFLSRPGASYSKSMQTKWGNRIRCSQWEELFSNLDRLNARTAFKWTRDRRPLPRSIDGSIQHAGEADLRVSHIGVFGQKKECRNLWQNLGTNRNRYVEQVA